VRFCPNIQIVHCHPSGWFEVPGTAEATIGFCWSAAKWLKPLAKVELKIGKN
jgi:hypothetical protein